MLVNILNLDFGYWGVFLLFLIPSLINAGIFIYVSCCMPSNRTNKAFSLFVLLICIEQVLDGLMHLSANSETAMLWARSSSALYLFICPVGVLFALRFTRWHKKIPHSLIFFSLFLPAIFLQTLTAAHLNQFSIEASATWHWILNPQRSLVTNIIYGWILGTALVAFALFWSYYFKEKEKTKKQQAFLLAAGFTFPFLAGGITEVIFPLILRINDIPLTSPAVTLFSLSSIIAIKKYNMLDYSPRHQWEKIIDTMKESLLILDNENKIMYANKKFCELSEYKWETLKGMPLDELLTDIVQKGPISEEKPDELMQTQFILKTSSGGRKYVIMSRASYLNNLDKIIGSINIFTNMTASKEMEMALIRNHERLKNAQQIAHVGSWELSFDTGMAVWSDEACRIYGLSLRDNVQSFESWLSFIHPDDLRYVKERIAVAQQNFSISFMKHRIICPDGTIKHIHSVSQYEFNAEGIPIGLSGTCHDITEQWETEQVLIENEKSIRNFASHLNETIENERRYMAREIHDEFGQYLTGIKLGFASLKRHCKNDEVAVKRIEALLVDMDACQQSVRKISNKLRPGMLDTLGLIPSMEWLIKDFQKKSDLQVDLTIKNGLDKNYDAHTSICFFRICQEALTNISKHAQASRAVINIKETPDGLLLKISDNGKGISGEKLKNPFSTGLLGMRERAHQIGAGLNITSAEGAGTTVLLELKTE